MLHQEIFSICGGGVAYWGPMLSLVEINLRVCCFETRLNIIYQERYLTFYNAFRLANMKSLKMREVVSITKFSKKVFKSENH